jgi:N-acetylglutamate synthase-like GNAT family acetyltransferase
MRQILDQCLEIADNLVRHLLETASTMVIRQANRADVPILTEVIRAAFRGVAVRFALTAETCPTHPSNRTTAWIEKELDKGVRYYIGEEGGKACGCVALERANPEACYLERLAVRPECREQGCGKALVDHVLAEARALGARRVEIGIIADQKELGAWYERLGFLPMRTARFDHLPFRVLFMSRPLEG